MILLIAACGGEKNETAEGSSDGTAAAETDPATDSASSSPSEATDASAGATDPGEDTVSEPTSVGSEPTSGPTTSEQETDTAEPPPDPAAACTALCDRFVECGLDDDPTCVAGCLDDFGGAQACSDAFVQYTACLLPLDCDAFTLGIEEPEQGACAELSGPLDAACGGSVCRVGGGGGPGQCEWQISCEGEPDQVMKCDDQTCACLVGDEQVGECPAEGICDTEFEGLEEKAAACCGF